MRHFRRQIERHFLFLAELGGGDRVARGWARAEAGVPPRWAKAGVGPGGAGRGETRQRTRRRSGRPAVGTPPAPRRRPRPGPRSPDGGSAPFRPHPRPPHESRGVLRAAGSRPERCRSSLRVTWDRGGRRGAGRDGTGPGGEGAARPGRETKGWDWGTAGGGGGRPGEVGWRRGPCTAHPAQSRFSLPVPGPASRARESGPRRCGRSSVCAAVFSPQKKAPCEQQLAANPCSFSLERLVGILRISMQVLTLKFQLCICRCRPR